MNIENELNELRELLNRLEVGKPGNWLGHWAKSLRMKKVKGQIEELEKQLKEQKND